MIKILVNDGISDDGKLLLEEAGYEVVTEQVPQDELPGVLNEYDAIIVRSATKVRRDLIEAAPNLKLIARGGVGLDNIDVEFARQKGIEVVNTPAASSQSVAELAFGHIFALARYLHVSNREMGGGDYKKLKNEYSEGIQLQGKTLGIIGFGRIGQASARIGLALGMKVLAHDPYVDEVNIRINMLDSDEYQFSVNIKTVPLDRVFSGSDIITLHVPGGENPLIGADEIAQMKTGAFLINTARGGTIDESALLEALASGKLGGAGLDVFVGEPKPNPALLSHPRVSVSPHIGASTQEAQANIGLELADRIIAYFGENGA